MARLLNFYLIADLHGSYKYYNTKGDMKFLDLAD